MHRLFRIILVLGSFAALSSAYATPATPTAPQAIVVGITTPANGSIQTSTSVTFTGTSTPGATLSLVIDGGVPISVTADAGGNWTYTASGLAQGNHTAQLVGRKELLPLRIYASQIVSPGRDVVHVIDTGSNTILATIPLSADEVEGLTVAPNGNEVWAAHGSGVDIIDTTTNAIVQSVPLAAGAQLARFKPDGTEVWVTQPANATIAIINAATKAVTYFNVGHSSHDVVFRPDSRYAYIATTDSVLNGGSRIVVVDTTTMTIVANYTIGDGNRRATISRDGQRVYVSGKNSDSIVVLNTTTQAIMQQITVGTDLDPEGMDESLDGSRLYVAMRTPSQIWTYNTTTMNRIVPETITASSAPLEAPMDLIVHPINGRLYVGDRSLVNVYDSPSLAYVTGMLGTAPSSRFYEFETVRRFESASSQTAFVVNATADLTIVKTALNTPWTVGQQGQYTLSVANAGPAPAQPLITVSDTLPAGTTFVSASGTSWACGASGQVVTCTRATALASGTTAPLITLTVTIGAAAAPSVTNTACVSNPNEGNSANNCSSVTTTIIPQADLSIIKAALNAPWIVGQQTQYTLAVANAGPNTAAAPITVTDTLPASLTFVSATGTGWACGASGQAITCTRATALASGTTAPLITLTVTIGAAAAPSVTNTATVTSSTPETSSGNNTSTVTTPVLVPQLAIQKSATPPNGTAVAAYDHITYTLRVENTGTLPLTNVRITDTIPLGTAYVPGSAQPAPITGPSPLVWSLPTLAVGGNATVSFAVEVLPVGTTVAITNTASASSTQTPEIISEEIIHPFDPTGVTLVRMTAHWVGDSVQVEWETSLEPTTAGFHLYGSATSQWPTATVQTTMLIASQGSTTTGATYQHVLDAQPGFSRPGPLYVWLEEREMDGSIHQYGPVTVQQTIFVPLIQR